MSCIHIDLPLFDSTFVISVRIFREVIRGLAARYASKYVNVNVRKKNVLIKAHVFSIGELRADVIYVSMK